MFRNSRVLLLDVQQRAKVQLVRMQLMAKGVVALHKSYAMGDNEAKLVIASRV